MACRKMKSFQIEEILINHQLKIRETTMNQMEGLLFWSQFSDNSKLKEIHYVNTRNV